MSNNSKFDSAELWGKVCEASSKKEHGEEIVSSQSSPSPKPPPSPSLTPKVESIKVEADENEKSVQTVLTSDISKEDDTNFVSTNTKEMAIAKSYPIDFHLDHAERLMPESFPNTPNEGSRTVPATIPNIRHMFDRYGVMARYNVIKKTPEFVVPGLVCTVDNADNVAMAQIKSLARLNGISVSSIEEAILAAADRNQYNPVATWIMSKPWDGTDRLPEFYDTLTAREGFLKEFKNILMFRWMISAVAAVLKPQGFKARGVLTLQGAQGLGKTSWFASLVPDISLRERNKARSTYGCR